MKTLSPIIKNYLAVAGLFLLFALLVGILSAFASQAIAYCVAVCVIGLLVLLEVIAHARLFRGLSLWAFLFLVSTATFPLSDLLGNAFPQPLLYFGFLGMLIFLALIWVKALKHREAGDDLA